MTYVRLHETCHTYERDITHTMSMRAWAFLRACSCVSYTHTHTRVHAHTHTHTHAHKNTHTHTHTHTHTPIHTHICIRVHVYIYKHTYVHTIQKPARGKMALSGEAIMAFFERGPHSAKVRVRGVCVTNCGYGVATVSRIDKSTGLFCKRAL